MPTNSLLENVRLANPCPTEWGRLSGGERVRRFRRVSRAAGAALVALLGLFGPAALAARLAPAQGSAAVRRTKVERVKAESPASLPVLRGVVSDINQAVVAGARVTLTRDGGKEKWATTTDDEGRFRFPAVGGGEYTVTVGSPGFASFRRGALTLEAGEDVTLGVTLAEAEPEGLTPAAAVPQ